MLQRIRDGLQSQKWLTYTVLGALVLVFTVWGAYGIVDLSIGTGNYAAKVEGEKITVQEANELWQRQQMMWSQRFGGELPPELRARMQDEILEAMVNETLLSKHARDLGYRVSREQVLEQVRQIPDFQFEGQYSPQAAQLALANVGLTPDQFAVSLQRDLERQQIEGAIRVSNFLTPAEQKRIHALQSEQREVRYAMLPADKFAAQAPVDDAAVQAYYDKNKDRYMTTESVRLAYGELRLEQLASQIVVTDKDLEAFYEQNKTSYVQPEKRQARHILIEAGSDAAAAEKKAQDVVAQAKSGKDFAELAKQFSQDPGSAQNGGDLGWSEKGNFDPAFDEALFGMQAGEIRGPVKTNFGYHIIKLEAVEPGKTRTLQEARAEIESEVRRSKAGSTFGDVQENIQERLEQPNADFDAIVKEFNLQGGEVAEFQRGAGGGALGAAPELDEVVFSSTVLDDKRIGGPVALGEDRLVIVKALEHHKPEPKPVAQVREEIVKSIRDEYGRAESAKAAEAAREKLASGTSFDDVAKELGVTVEPARFIGRDDPSVPAQVRTGAFGAAKPGVGKSVYRTVPLETGGAAVIALSNVRMDPNAKPTLELPEQRDLMARQGQVDATAYMQELRRTADVSKNPKAFE